MNMKRIFVVWSLFLILALTLLAVILCCDALPALAEEPQTAVAVMPEVTVQGVRPSQELIGPYNQPRWAARASHSSSSAEIMYCRPMSSISISITRGLSPSTARAKNLFTQEFELGLPHRFQIAYENNFVLQKEHSQITTADHRGTLCPGRLGQASRSTRRSLPSIISVSARITARRGRCARNAFPTPWVAFVAVRAVQQELPVGIEHLPRVRNGRRTRAGNRLQPGAGLLHPR